ncbi:VOC family protein [Streptomyces sp. NBC_01481]|uniref:VOC family protein n=1 Tax=Streptomyces sp. NBC_01481 TaxID=2975869 RepID=UPI002253D325|nr:VOC family protein [Streptomyces sp. NBC_01481]MCX4587209.1 VOC family protein [Streptomyces sp. NBC_01481]
MAGEISFFELGVGDFEAARAFYGSLFGWSFDPGPTEGGGYAIGTPNVPGGVHGGDAGASPYLFFRVDDMKAALERVHELGGTVDDFDAGSDDESVARFGRFTLCHDDQGSPFGLHEPPKNT